MIQPEQVMKAIEIYLSLAYRDAIPMPVRSRVETLRQTAPHHMLESEAFERTPSGAPQRYSLRLGNSMYPHMKLSIDRRPDSRGFLFRTDTHDRHIAPPPGSPEEPLFREMQARNQQLAQAIEAAWTEQGLPTFKSYLREDLARRKKAARSG